MKFFSMFSGIGGFELGIKQAYENDNSFTKHSRNTRTIQGVSPSRNKSSSKDGRPTCVGYSEIDKHAIQIYEKHFNHKNYGDATKIIPSELPDFDLLCGGFPCQSFSIAGKRGGFKDTRGTLFFDVARIARVKRPKILFLENVKGLLSHDEGNTFATIIRTIDELGYDCEWQVLNSKNFGVPQNRERVFIIGYLRGTSRRQVFPIGESGEVNNESDGQGNAYCLQAGGDKHRGTYVGELKELTKDQSQGNRIYDPKGVATTVAAQAGGQGAKTGLYAIPVLTPDRPTKRQNGRRFKENNDPNFTLTSQDKHGVFNGAKIRRLTPTECARLQGFPDDWHEGLSDTQAYKCYGNAVTVNVIQAIAEKLLTQK